MFKVVLLLFVIIAPTLAGLFMVGVLASGASPTSGGASISQGTMILIAVAVGVILAMPISFFVGRAINRRIST